MNDTWQSNVIFVTFDRKPKKPLTPSNGAAVWLDDEWEELETAEGSLEDEAEDEIEIAWLEPDQGGYDDDEEEDEIL